MVVLPWLLPIYGRVRLPVWKDMHVTFDALCKQGDSSLRCPTYYVLPPISRPLPISRLLPCRLAAASHADLNRCYMVGSDPVT